MKGISLPFGAWLMFYRKPWRPGGLWAIIYYGEPKRFGMQQHLGPWQLWPAKRRQGYQPPS